MDGVASPWLDFSLRGVVVVIIPFVGLDDESTELCTLTFGRLLFSAIFWALDVALL